MDVTIVTKSYDCEIACNDSIMFNIFFAVPITLTPRYGHLFGGTPVIVTGPCFSVTDSIRCMFGGTEQSAIKFSEESVLCVSPLLTKIGSTRFTLIIKQEDKDEEIIFESTFLAG